MISRSSVYGVRAGHPARLPAALAAAAGLALLALGAPLAGFALLFLAAGLLAAVLVARGELEAGATPSPRTLDRATRDAARIRARSTRRLQRAAQKRRRGW